MNSLGLLESRYNAILALLQTIAKREGIINPTIEITKGCEKGDGYAGEKNLATLRDGNKTLEVFIKAAPTSEAYKKQCDPRFIYMLEIFFYNDIMPTFLAFQLERNIPKPFTSVLKQIGYSDERDNEIIVLENAKTLGFELWPRMKQMNAEHVEFIYAEYGKYHGLSYALEDQKPEVFRRLVDNIPLNAFQLLADTMEDGFVRLAEIGKPLFDPIKEVEVYEAYAKFVDYIPEFLQMLPVTKDKYAVIVHGDCWSSNMMFKYEQDSDKSRPTEMCLIDFQLTGHTSPTTDLSYFMYASAPKEIYNNLDHYLRIYHQSLTKTILDLGCDANVIPSIEEIKNQWKFYSKYALLMCLIVLKICIQENDETTDISQVLEETGGSDITVGFSKESKNDSLYHERLRSLVFHMVENKFL